MRAGGNLGARMAGKLHLRYACMCLHAKLRWRRRASGYLVLFARPVERSCDGFTNTSFSRSCVSDYTPPASGVEMIRRGPGTIRCFAVLEGV